MDDTGPTVGSEGCPAPHPDVARCGDRAQGRHHQEQATLGLRLRALQEGIYWAKILRDWQVQSGETTGPQPEHTQKATSVVPPTLKFGKFC